MFPIARIGDPASHDKLAPAGVVAPSTALPPCTVIVEGMPAARLGDFVACTGATCAGPAHPPQAGPPPAPLPWLPIVSGSAKVVVGGAPAARWTADASGCGVFLGDEKLVATRRVRIG
jgi:uncharacterized Zn-binding protein involved in type VI secretion